MRELTVSRLGLQGDGLAGEVRAPFTLPGERIRGPVEGGVMAPAEILDPSPDRVTPPCRHFGTCGGCALQHASDGFVADWKRAVVRRALAARGLAAEPGPTLTSPPRSRRRAVFAGRRTRKTAVVGFHGRRSETLIDVTECHVVRPELLAARPALRAVTRIGASRAHGLRLTVTLSEGGLDLDVADGRPLDAGPAACARGAGRGRGPRAAVLVGRTDRGPSPAGADPRARPGGPAPAAFLQATAEGAAALTGAVRAVVGDAGRVADLFAGCGTFALPLAAAAEVHAVEGSTAMLAALDAGWRSTPGLKRVGVETRDLFRRPLTPAELDRFDAVVIDPPRAGAEAQAHALAAARVPVVAAVSCNPVSFARDAAILVAGGYRLEAVQAVDQFRWSGHVEIVAAFRR